MKKLNLLLLFLLLFTVSCATNKSSDRGPAASNDVAIERVAEACDIDEDFLGDLVDNNAVPDEARYLSGGGGFQTFLMKDGRLVIVSGVRKNSSNKCKIDHLKIDEGEITSTFANGRRLFMAVRNTRGSGRVYVMTAVKDQDARDPYQVHEIKYDHRRFANASSFERRTIKVGSKNKYGVAVIHRDGHAYNRELKPWEWGDNNEYITSKEHAVKIDLIPVRPSQRVVRIERPRVETRRPTVTYLPKPPKTCRAEEKISFFFGLFSISNSVEVPCS
jgi:hypothetical protein